MKFLKRHSFTHLHTRGSHFYYVGEVGGTDRQDMCPSTRRWQCPPKNYEINYPPIWHFGE